jgi:hypothetical protein
MDMAAGSSRRRDWDTAMHGGDRRAVEAVLRAALVDALGPGWRIQAFSWRHLRRSASRRAATSFEAAVDLDLADAGGGRTATVRYHGGTQWPTALPAEVGFGTLGVEPALGPAVIDLPDLGAALWAQPNDPALPQLARLLTPSGVQAALPAPWRDTAEVASVELLSLASRRHAVLRVTLKPQADDAGASPTAPHARPGRSRVLVAKTFADDKALRVHERVQALWARGGRDGEAPRMARPLGVDPASFTVWYAFVPGPTLAQALEGTHAESALAAAARTIAHLHEVPLPLEACRDVAFWCDEVSRRARKLERLLPTLAPRIRALADGLLDAVPRLPPAHLSALHGDCQPGQFIVADGVATVLDLDSMVRGMPMEDLAECLQKLQALPHLDIDRCAEAFLRAYRLAAPARFEASWLHWHQAVQALLAASRAAMALQADWPRLAADAIAAAHRSLARLRDTRPVATARPPA